MQRDRIYGPLGDAQVFTPYAAAALPGERVVSKCGVLHSKRRCAEKKVWCFQPTPPIWHCSGTVSWPGVSEGFLSEFSSTMISSDPHHVER